MLKKYADATTIQKTIPKSLQEEHSAINDYSTTNSIHYQLNAGTVAMTRYLESMSFPSKRGSTKQKAAVGNTRMHKVTVNVGLIMKQFFSSQDSTSRSRLCSHTTTSWEHSWINER